MISYFSEADVAELLSVGEAVELVEEAFRIRASGGAVMPERLTTSLGAHDRFLRVMPAAVVAQDRAGVKIGCVLPDRRAAAVHYLLYDIAGPRLLAVLEADWLGQLRTAGASAVATRRLANPGAGTVCLLGTGKHARTQLLAVCSVLNATDVRVYSPHAERRRAFVATMLAEFPELPIRETVEARTAVTGADVIVTATRSKVPVLEAGWIAPGAHINAVGSNHPRAREVDAATLGRSTVFVDSMDQASRESGDLLLAVEEGVFSMEEVRAELGEVLVGAKEGRTSREQVTLFKSNGLPIQDLVLADAAYRRAMSGTT